MSTAASPLRAVVAWLMAGARRAATRLARRRGLDAVLTELSGLLRSSSPEKRARSPSRSARRRGKAFLLQAGDCAESFNAFPPTASATSSRSSCRCRCCSLQRACRR
jgi:3-deoxy-D-arabino-heptulosonate 7-phosphate (DAHP) synthase class II